MAASIVLGILVLLAVIAIVVYAERLMDLRRAQIDYEDFLKGIFNILKSGNDDEALSICEDTTAPVASIVATAIRHANGSARVLREAVDSQGRAQVGRLDRRLATLAIIAQIAPILGLLGTILGFIQTLLIAHGSEIVSRADLMDGAMSALLPAAVGLAVTIPVSVMYGSLRVRLERTVVDLEAAASQIIGFISQRKEGERK